MLCSCVIPQTVMGIAYAANIMIEPKTLLLSLLFSIIGSVVGVKIVSFLNEKIIHRIICAALILSSCFMILGLLDVLPMSGKEMGLHSMGQILNCLICFLLSGLSMAGFPVTALNMSLTSSLGLSARAVYTISTTSSSLTNGFGGSVFIRQGLYDRYMTAVSTIAGSAGALIAVFVVKNMNTLYLQWVIAFLALYSGVSLFLKSSK